MCNHLGLLFHVFLHGNAVNEDLGDDGRNDKYSLDNCVEVKSEN